MISIQRFDVVSPRFNHEKSVDNRLSGAVSLSVGAHKSGSLENYLSLVGQQNLSLISFKGKAANKQELYKYEYPSLSAYRVNLPGTDVWVDAFRPSLSKYAQWKISTEATDRIYGKRDWSKLKNIEAWMVTAETDEFMIVGGLGKVASDIPHRFNRKFLGDKKNNMTIVTPLYTYKDEYKVISKDGKYIYQYGKKLNKKTKQQEPRMIELDEIASLNVPVYNPKTNTSLQDTEVKVFSAYVNNTVNPKTGKPNNDGTRVIFLSTPDHSIGKNGNLDKNAPIFDIEEENINSENNKTPYANSKYGTDEVTRMAFFSKAVYTLMKELKEGRVDNTKLKVPNAVLLNDWHAGATAAMIRYGATADADSGKITPETGKYFDKLNLLYILHNCEHQGSTGGDNNKRTSIFATLFGEYSVDILSNALSWRSDSPQYNPKYEDKVAMMQGSAFSCGATGLMLADRVVPVSENYAQELLQSDTKSRGFKDLFKARAFSPFKTTLTPITNGYTKSLIAPTEKHMDSILEQARTDLVMKKVPKVKIDDISLKPFDDGNLENKLYDKNQVMKLLKRIHTRELKLADSDIKGIESRKYFMYDPENTVIPDVDDFKDIPVIVFAGRVDPQKGVGTILTDALRRYAKENVDTPKDKLPLFIIGGKITQDISYQRLKNFKEELKTLDGGKYKDFADRIVLFKGYVNTNLLATAADMFLVPSVFEPCGLTQMEAMAKGALPVATSTGGLVNTVQDGVDGFRTKAFFEQEGFETKGRLYGEEFESNGEAYNEALQRAITMFNDNRSEFEKMQKTAIANDFSWDKEGGPLDKFIELIKTGKITQN